MDLGDRLEAEGYSVEFAVDGEEAIQKASRRTSDLVLLDVMLPRKNGFDVCRDIRAAGVLVPILDRKSTRLNSSHANISYAVFCLKKKKKKIYDGNVNIEAHQKHTHENH